MSRSDLRTFDTDATAPTAQDGRDSAVERAEPGRPAGRQETRTTTDRSAIAYCVDNDLI
ncbi:hypothetical protein PQJ75_21915 [Rhodoplanes sp. TEM]|uniref:Uncharacterized protein n=1 Tax=Rhodoplanes tepidamans TaxID=200616 RepID=A0ABT5JHX3_RHOTP|nr:MULTISPECIES: hypothetical protein [Rhodoplanes]MDC7789003.1 hypothetical protein [Rhodoplanes tepidamans]MDC7986395.1 hypothetical protein [Rhodoplanes sp. TEM]MDQ0355716.1 hypothetical protein [Rhodoplanes tepidamans]